MIRKKVGQRTEELSSVYYDMPFTPAHPAILLPLKIAGIKRISWTALITGSIVPDFDYFIWLSPASTVGHTYSGIFLFCLPLTLMLSFIWHRLISPVLLPHLDFFRTSLEMEKYPDFFEWLKGNWIPFIFSACIGIGSHLTWDSFCHANGYMVHHIPYLSGFSNIAGYEIRRCYILWYISTVAGISLLSVWMLSFKKLSSPIKWRKFFSGGKVWGKIIFFSLLIATLRITLGLSWNWFRHIVIIASGSFFYAIILVCWIEMRKKEQVRTNIKHR